MANKAISCGAYIQFILDDEEHFVFKSGVTIENPYGGSINNVAIYIDGETTTPHWYGDYTTFDEPLAGSGADLKTALDALLVFSPISEVENFIDLLDVPASYTGQANKVVSVNGAETALEFTTPGGVSDGDKGDITVSGVGTVWTIDNDVVTFGKMQNINTARLVGRNTAAVGDIEELTLGNGLEFNVLELRVATQMSIDVDPSGIMLENDEASPGINQVYGTDAAGVKGWKADPTGGSGLTHPQVMARVSIGF